MRFPLPLIVGLAIVTVMTGCVSEPKSRISDSQVGGTSNPDLCREYHRTRSSTVLAELKSRSALNEHDIDALQHLKGFVALTERDMLHLQYVEPTLGMSVLGLYCFYGVPEETNETTTPAGTQAQYVYCENYARLPSTDPRESPTLSAIAGTTREQYCGKRFYVYTDGGTVSAFQNAPPLPSVPK
jgi:hypothetical protein